MTSDKYWNYVSYILKEEINPQKYLYIPTVEELVKKAFKDGKDTVNMIEFDDTLLVVNGIYKGKFGKLIAHRYETSAEKHMGTSAIIIVDGKYEIEVPLRDCRKIIT